MFCNIPIAVIEPRTTSTPSSMALQQGLSKKRKSKNQAGGDTFSRGVGVGEVKQIVPKK
jgi:hypothetical protein